MGDHALLAALRCQDEGALREFFLRFRPGLVRAARRLEVVPGELDTLVDDVLADVAVHLISSEAPAPRSLPAYLARSLRNRVLNQVRSRDRAERRLVEGADLPAVASPGAAADGAPLSPALQRLAAALEAPLSVAERLLTVWMSHCVPRPEIAAWLGIAPKAAAKRIARLRERLQLAALEYVDRSEGAERRELLAFLGRADLAARPAARLVAVRATPERTAHE
jgi:DNA-directed RNA polymerase specialized sigma24 family protein